MRAVVLRKHGSVDGLVLEEVPKPSPQPDEVLVQVHATTVTRGDVAIRKMPWILARMTSFGRRTILGHEFAGVVEAVGDGARRFGVGDRVFGSTTGLAQGSHAEYLCVPDGGVLATIPTGVSFADAACVPSGGLTALYFLRRAGIEAGSSVLIYGASGSVGTFAVQLAAHLGGDVTGVCSTSNVELVRSLGAGTVIDYTAADFTAGGATYDVVFDAVGKAPVRRTKALVADQGAYVSVHGTTAEQTTEDLMLLRDLLGSGQLRPVIDRRYSLDQVPEAHRYVETGQKRGNVVIMVSG